MTDHTGTNDPDALKLVAFDAEDLSVISAHVQDAETQASNMAYLAPSQRFVIMLARHDWPSLESATPMRIQTGVHFDHVKKISSMGFDRTDSKPIRLLSVTFASTDTPSGHVTLTFADGAAIRLEVECLDVQMRDIGPRWTVHPQAGQGLNAKGETEFGS